MAIWITSDLHFNHNRDWLYGSRGFSSVEEMNQGIITRFNSCVDDEDLVYILGDICLGGSSEETLQENKKLIEQLHGCLYIVRGNHDTDKRINMYKECRNVVKVADAAYLTHKHYHFYLSHYPSITTNREKIITKTTLNLYGHTHQKDCFFNDMPHIYHVGVDSHNCYPVHIDQIIQEINLKAEEI